MKHLAYLTLFLTILSCQTDNTKYYVKSVTFGENTPVEEKIKMAAHVVPSKKLYPVPLSGKPGGLSKPRVQTAPIEPSSQR